MFQDMLHEIGIIVLSKQVDLITTPSNKFHQMTHKVKYCKRGLFTRHGHVIWNLNHLINHVSIRIELTK
jgi:hypothetical protein